MTSYVENESEITFPFSVEEIMDKVLRVVMTIESCPYEATVNLLLTDNEGIKQFNKEYRMIDKETDVLSFPTMEYETPSFFQMLKGQRTCFDPDTDELLLGDIILSTEKVLEQAESYGHSVIRELAFLLVHSMLHLCGYDHIDLPDAKVMEERQTLIMDTLDIRRELTN